MTAEGTNRQRTSLKQTSGRIGSLYSLHHGRPFRVMALAALLSLAGATPTRGQANPSVEYQVKAAFVFNFAKFVEWPLDTFKSENAPIVFCVFGHDPFGSALGEGPGIPTWGMSTLGTPTAPLASLAVSRLR
jgi:hypothetical protein